MSIARSRFIKRCAEFISISHVKSVPHKTRGVYTLLKKSAPDQFEVLYVGKSAGTTMGIRNRLNTHKRSKTKRLAGWDHFCVYEVWENISEIEIKELEGLVRHIYRKDFRVNSLNKQRGFKPLKKKPVRNDSFRTWK